MKIALLGTGAEVELAAQSIINSGHNIIAVTSPSVQAIVSERKGQITPELVSHHNEVNLVKLDYVVLLSYAPLIEASALRSRKFLNIHYALLPKYRGMHPIQWGLINGEAFFGYTLHLVDEGVDSGPIIFQDRTAFSSEANYAEVKAKISERLLVTLGDALTSFEQKKLSPQPQNDALATYFAKRGFEDGLIDWHLSAADIHNLIRALAPPEMPGAYFYLAEDMISVVSSAVETCPEYIGPTGRVVKIEGGDVLIKCGKGLLRINRLLKNSEEVTASALLKRIGLRLGRQQS